MHYVPYIIIVAALGCFYFAIRWLTAPRPDPEILAITVWATFVPYSTVESAEKNLRRAAGIVFGEHKVKERENDDLILNAIGSNLSKDESIEAKSLLTFLVNVYRANGKEIKTLRDIGVAWFACLQVGQEDPTSELAKTFKVLSDAWHATQQDQKHA